MDFFCSLGQENRRDRLSNDIKDRLAILHSYGARRFKDMDYIWQSLRCDFDSDFDSDSDINF